MQVAARLAQSPARLSRCRAYRCMAGQRRAAGKDEQGGQRLWWFEGQLGCDASRGLQLHEAKPLEATRPDS